MSVVKGESEWMEKYTSGALDQEGLSEEWLEMERGLGFRPMVSLQGTIAEQRQVLEDGCKLRDLALPSHDLEEDVTFQDREISVAGQESIPIRIYRPKTRKPGTQPAPVALYYHGGGWTLGSIAADDIFARMIARDLGHVVVSVAYRLAPENPFPAAVDDCYSALLWAFENITQLQGDVDRVYVTGNSAGGQLAAAVALKAAESDIPFRLAAQILRIPLTCHPDVYPGTRPPRESVPIFNDSALTSMLNSYTPNTQDYASILISPLLATDGLLRRSPPTFIDVCSADPLAPGGMAFAKRLEENGVPVKLFVLEGMPHGSYILFPGMNASKVAHRACMEGTLWALEASVQN